MSLFNDLAKYSDLLPEIFFVLDDTGYKEDEQGRSLKLQPEKPHFFPFPHSEEEFLTLMEQAKLVLPVTGKSGDVVAKARVALEQLYIDLEQGGNNLLAKAFAKHNSQFGVNYYVSPMGYYASSAYVLVPDNGRHAVMFPAGTAEAHEYKREDGGTIYNHELAHFMDSAFAKSEIHKDSPLFRLCYNLDLVKYPEGIAAKAQYLNEAAGYDGAPEDVQYRELFANFVCHVASHRESLGEKYPDSPLLNYFTKIVERQAQVYIDTSNEKVAAVAEEFRDKLNHHNPEIPRLSAKVKKSGEVTDADIAKANQLVTEALNERQKRFFEHLFG